VLGVELARQVGARTGDKVTIVAPGGQVTPAGVVPRLKQFTLVGVFEAGHYEYDSGLALIHVDDAARLFRVEVPPACSCAWPTCTRRAAPPLRCRPAWARTSMCATGRGPTATGSTPVQIEKRLMFIILTLIVAVAAFNHRQHAGDDGHRQARRYRHPAHARRQPAIVMASSSSRVRRPASMAPSAASRSAWRWR